MVQQWYDSGWAKREQKDDEPLPMGLVVKLTTLADDIVEDTQEHLLDPEGDERQDRTRPDVIHRKPGEGG